MTNLSDSLKQWMTGLAFLIEQEIDPAPSYFVSFRANPALALELVHFLGNLEKEEADAETPSSLYSAAIFAIDLCVAELQVASSMGSKLHRKILIKMMEEMADVMLHKKHDLGFWLPALNAFYEAEVDLLPRLSDAYHILAENEEIIPEEDHMDAMRDMLSELSEFGVFEMTESLFAQGHAMSGDLFRSVVADLLSLEEGRDVVILALLHPKYDVRLQVFETIQLFISDITLSPRSLLRLEYIKSWYPVPWQEEFNRWIRVQRKKGVVFFKVAETPSSMTFEASEVDGSGAQGIFIHIRHQRKHYLCGVLFRAHFGIRDAWVSEFNSKKEIKAYQEESFDSSITMRPVTFDYFVMMAKHFLHETLERGAMPDVHFVEILELLGVEIKPESIDIPSMMFSLSVQISPFTPDAMRQSFMRSKITLLEKQFTESWFVEDPEVDRLVNRESKIVNGIRVCDIEKATELVFSEQLQKEREKWCFHFLWMALWLKAREKKNEKVWEDVFFIAYHLYANGDMRDIPVLWEICRQSVVNSIETMGERRTHLSGDDTF